MLLLPVLLATSFWSRKPFFPLPSPSRVWRTQSWLQNPAFFSPHAISLLPFPGGDAQAVPVQTPELQRRVKGSSASMACRMSTENIVHWYKQLPGEPLKRILYMSGQSPVFDDRGDRSKFQVRKHSTQPLYDLTIDYLTPRDSGTYYCAYWLYQGITALDGQR